MTSVRISIEVILQAENSRRRLLHNNVFRQLQCGWSECCSLSVLLTCSPIAPASLGKQIKSKKILQINLLLLDWSRMTDIWLTPCGRSQFGSDITRSSFLLILALNYVRYGPSQDVHYVPLCSKDRTPSGFYNEVDLQHWVKYVKTSN